MGSTLSARTSSSARYRNGVPLVTETIQVNGVRCERCVMRLAKMLEGHEGLEAANANLLGQVTVTWDDAADIAGGTARGDGPRWLSRARSGLTRGFSTGLHALGMQGDNRTFTPGTPW